MSNPKWIALNLVIEALDEIEAIARDPRKRLFCDIVTCCERQKNSFQKIGWSMKQPDGSGEIDVDQCELIRLRDKDSSHQIRFLAGVLLRLIFEVRYPNEDKVKTINPPIGERFFDDEGNETSR
jgi:hypothetical protein